MKSSRQIFNRQYKLVNGDRKHCKSKFITIKYDYYLSFLLHYLIIISFNSSRRTIKISEGNSHDKNKD